jgi:hypothetical protein
MSPRRTFFPVLLGLISLTALACGPGPSDRATSDELAADFAHPPDSARPWAYWMWMDGNLTREGITADLEAMREAGLGGVVICEVTVGVPRGPVEFMSPAWRGLFKHVVREAERFGLEVTLTAGPGWTGSGGPWVKPETSMQHIVAAAVEDGRIVFSDGMSYRMLVLPERETMTPALLRKVRDLVQAGAVVLGPRPRRSPSLSGYPECDAEVLAPAGEVWGDCDGAKVTEHAFGLGRVVWVSKRMGTGPEAPVNGVSCGSASSDRTMWEVGAPPLNEPEQYGDFAVVTGLLKGMSVPPDLSSDVPLRWTHRRDGGTEIYFLTNPENRVVETAAVFRVSGLQPELWDPVTGEIRNLAQYAPMDGRTSVSLRFEPLQSFFVVFRTTAGPPSAAGPDFSVPVEAVRLGGPWEVSFDPRWGGPEKVVFETLDDWSLRPEEGIKYYSGTAVYRRTFDLNRGMPAGDIRLWLDLGTVKNIARVKLNGRDLGILWCDPWRVDITEDVKDAGNRLEILIANLWPNRLIGDEREPPDAEYARDGRLARWPDWLTRGEPRSSPGRLTFATWEHFAKDSPLLPSGLLGPVRILRVSRGMGLTPL